MFKRNDIFVIYGDFNSEFYNSACTAFKSDSEIDILGSKFCVVAIERTEDAVMKISMTRKQPST